VFPKSASGTLLDSNVLLASRMVSINGFVSIKSHCVGSLAGSLHSQNNPNNKATIITGPPFSFILSPEYYAEGDP
jgi:hypothetical protein